MRPIARALEQHFLVLNVDLPGHGKSAAPAEPWGVPEHADAVAELIRSEMRPPVTIVGHSNGGRIALFMASMPGYSELIRRLVLVSPSGMTPTRSWTYYARKSLAAALKAPFALLPPKLRGPGLEWLRGSALWRWLGSSDYRALSGVMRETFVKTVTTHLDEEVHKVDVPTLVFWGSQDHDVRRDQIDRLVDRVPDAGLVVLENAGHYGYLDEPETVMGGIIHFVKGS
jgi:pimeloyl-ACP methyl ester carboxylesterase